MNNTHFTWLVGVCLICGERFASYDTKNRMCSRCGETLAGTRDEKKGFVTICPDIKVESDDPLASFVPPVDDAEGLYDIFAVRGYEGRLGEHIRPVSIEREREFLKMPFPIDLLHSDFGIRCGNATLVDTKPLMGFECSVLDMSTYSFSSTLKDLRSWAIVNIALQEDIRHLALWTAGNAGYSLARLCYFVNQRLPRSRHLHVHSFVDSETDPRIEFQLRRWRSSVFRVRARSHFGSSRVLLEEDMWEKVEEQDQAVDQGDRWHVTDGWDGVGILMYRLIALQVLQQRIINTGRCYYDRVICPLGSGDILLGFLWAIRDLYPNKESRPSLIAAVPRTGHFLSPPSRIPKRDQPVMPKLIADYTPLIPLVNDALSKEEFTPIYVTRGDQAEALTELLGGGFRLLFALEPSAIAAFGALCHLSSGRHREAMYNPYHEQGRTLIINSGAGIMGFNEAEWLVKGMFPARKR